MNDRSCTDPESLIYDDVRNIKRCFDSGSKLACIPRLDRSTIPTNLGWSYETSSMNPNLYVIFKDQTVHAIFREVVDSFKNMEPKLRTTYFLNDLGDCMIGDIINGFFFGYCFIDIAEYVFIRNDDIMFQRIKKFIENTVKEMQRNPDPNYLESKTDLLRRISTCKKDMNSSFGRVFDTIHRVASEIMSRIKRQNRRFNMNSHVIHNIRTATTFHGDCALNVPSQNFNTETDTDTSLGKRQVNTLSRTQSTTETEMEDGPGFGTSSYR